MFERSSALLGALAAVLLLAGCASTGNSGRKGVTRANLGTAARSTIVSETAQILTTRYGYFMNRNVIDTEDIRFETDWKEESALADEREAGFTHARTRIIIFARPRNRSSGGSQNLVVTFEAENQVLPFGNNVWVSATPSKQRRDVIDQITSFIRRTYQTALR
jgi:hypothetical protein